MAEGREAGTGRVLAIDALRGFDMFWIIGGDKFVPAVALWIAGFAGGEWVARAAKFSEQFEHVEWHGFRFYDLIFPMFLFLVGAVLPFSLGKFSEDDDTAGGYGRLVRRTILLLAFAFAYAGFLNFRFLSHDESGWHTDWRQFRFAGVLQRIALCYFFAGVVNLHFRAWGQSAFVVLILAGYWALLTYFNLEPNAAGDLSKEGSIVGAIDRKFLPGRLWYGLGDNEGILSTIPAIATTLIGSLAGLWLRSDSQINAIKCLGLLAAGATFVYGGWMWDIHGHFPVNKILWTSSFVLVTAGWSLILLGVFYFFLDVCLWTWWAYPFVVIGANAITIYLLQHFVDFGAIAMHFVGGALRHMMQWNPDQVRTEVGRIIGNMPSGSEKQFFAAVMFVGTALLLKWLVLWLLYRNRIFLRA